MESSFSVKENFFAVNIKEPSMVAQGAADDKIQNEVGVIFANFISQQLK